MAQTYSNQRHINVNKSQSDKANLYAKINLNALDTALQVLSPNAFKVFTYLVKHQNGYSFYLSAVDLLLKCGISDSTYRRVWKELQEKGYIIPIKAGSKTQYNFYDTPQEQTETAYIVINKTE